MAPSPRRVGMSIMAVIARGWRLYCIAVNAIARAFAYVGAGAIFLSIFVILREAGGRYFFDAPTTYAYPLVSLLVVVILYFSLAYTATIDGHVSSDVIFSKLPPRAQAIVLLIGDLTAAGLGALLGREMWGQVSRSVNVEARMAQLGDLPVAVPQACVLVGSVLLTLVAITKIPGDIAVVVTGRRDTARVPEVVAEVPPATPPSEVR